MRCSLWLMPDDPAPWTAVIGGLASRHHGPVFPPHLTLIGGLDLGEDQARDALRATAAAIAPLALTPLAVGHGLSRHQSVFVLVRPDPLLVAARRVAGERFARDEATFMPHVSLFYGQLDDAGHAAVDRELSSWRPPPLRASRLHLWATGGDEAGWRDVAVAPLTGR
jgi:hypothetical protein